MEKHLFEKVEQFVASKLQHDTSGHSMDHIHRVVKLTQKIAIEENANVDVCVLAAYLHDVVDDKMVQNSDKVKSEIISLLENLAVSKNIIEQIMTIISTMSFSFQLDNDIEHSLESKVVQDADRLDAIGAIGIARTFLYAGDKGSSLYDPNIQPRIKMTKSSYRNEKSTAINHFYEKLLLLKDLMHTQTGKNLAQKRHIFMENYLIQFFDEWKGIQ